MKKARKKKGPDADNISRRQRAFRQGRRAEVYARWVLRAKGYRVLARNFHHPLGEVDLIVRRGRLLIFVEVKFRADRDTGPYAVSPLLVAAHQRGSFRIFSPPFTLCLPCLEV